MNTTHLIVATKLCLAVLSVHAAELHVATTGDDTKAGTAESPLRSVQRAADLAQPGDVITVHAGTYRERINPPRGGESAAKRIVYQAAPGEKVELKGSEIIKGWVKESGEVWKITLPNSFFSGFNPYSDLIRGDWFSPRGRQHHTGAVYLNGEWLTEAATLAEVMLPDGAKPAWLGGSDARNLLRGLNPQLWFAEVGPAETTIRAQFNGVDPNRELVEINVRRTVFYPDQPGRNFITVHGFTMRHAATPWAPPTAEQIGLIGTHWSKGWLIENNVISHSICSGIALGKHGDQFDNTSADTATGYVKTIERAHAFAIPWTKDNIGHHVVRNNTISHCEQAGIVGSLGAAFCTVTDNTIHDIHIRRLFSGAEMAGIKFHAAIDTEISRNHIYRTCQALWLDWMAQGTRVSANLFHDNEDRDLFLEVNHGPFMVDNNLFLSPTSLLDVSEGGAFAHNLFAGRLLSSPEPNRETPYHPAHSTTVAGLRNIGGGDHRFYHNLFVGTGKSEKSEPRSRRLVGSGLWIYDERPLPLEAVGNVYYFGARPYLHDQNPLVLADHNPGLQLTQQGGRVDFQFTMGDLSQRVASPVLTSAMLGKAKISGLPYENSDGSPLKIDKDYFGKPRSPNQPTPGPFETPPPGLLRLKD